MNNSWTTLADDSVIQGTVEALERNGISASVVETGEDAKQKVMEMIPEGAEVMNMTSMTLKSTGIEQELLESGRFNAVRDKLNDEQTPGDEKKKLGAGPVWAAGSVHAVTKDGTVLIASNTGSQLPAYAYGSQHVVWVVGAHKIVKNFEEGIKRIYEYVLPLEADRARKAYGSDGSNVSKLLVVNKEVVPDRISLIFVKEALGY